MKRVFILSILILFISLCTGSISAGTTKLLSYNIKGHSMTSSRLADIATIINTQNPDIVALQEVDNRSLGIFNHDYLSELAESTGMHSQFFALVGTYYGIGILSKTEPSLLPHRILRKTRSPAVFSLPNLTTSISFVRIILLMPMTEILRQNGLSALHGKVIRLSLSLATSMLSLLIGQW